MTNRSVFQTNRGEVIYEDESGNRTNPGLLTRFQDRLSGMFGRSSSSSKNMRMGETIYVEQGPVHTTGQPTVAAPVITNRMPSKVSYNEPPLNQGAVQQATVQPNAEPAVSVSTEPEGVTQVNFRPAQSQNKAQSVIQAKFLEKVGHEEDFSWITGQLGQANGRWVIHYATPETVDRFSGNLVLAGNADMSSFQVGDLVSIQGGVIQTSSHGPAYLIQTINLIEKK